MIHFKKIRESVEFFTYFARHCSAIYVLALSLVFMSWESQAQSNWTQKGTDILGQNAQSELGWSSSISSDGTIVAVGAPGGLAPYGGEVKIYQWNGSNWTQMGNSILGAAGDATGWSIDLSGDGLTIAIGSRFYDGIVQGGGAARVYYWNGLDWIEKGQGIFGATSGDFVGNKVRLDLTGDILVLGTASKIFTQGTLGEVAIYEWDGLNWVLKGQPIMGEYHNHRCGWDIAVSDQGTTVVIGYAPFGGCSPSLDNQVRVFEWNGSTWSQKGSIITKAQVSDQTGSSVDISMDGNTIAVGSAGYDINSANSQVNNGLVRIFEFDGNDWTQKGSNILGVGNHELFGTLIRLADNGAFFGAVSESYSNSTYGVGIARFYKWNGNDWITQDSSIVGVNESDHLGQFEGLDIDANGHTIIVGTAWSDDLAFGAGKAQIFYKSHLMSINYQNQVINLVWPNPTTGIINFLEPKVENIRITDIQGKVFFEGSFQNQLNITNFPSGIYLIQLKNRQGYHAVKKLVKQ